MTVVTRFAPSPTGFLHIGNARTALFSWLFARHSGGKFLLRVEDTDRERHTEEAVQAIYDGLKWLGLEWDGEAVRQFARKERHAAVAQELLAKGKAYACYATGEELAALREKNQGYDRRWRERNPKEAPAGMAPAIRLMVPLDRDILVRDEVRGEVRVPAGQLEDLVILRSDGTPTYNLAVVVDDHDMGVTHIIRGEDHLTNAAKQMVIYEGMGWDVPGFAHIPLIHGPDGSKLSKRHGALGVDAYRDMGYLPEALNNYLLRLGWAHGDDEIISRKQAIEWFTIEGIGKSASRFDFTKLENLNGHYIRESEDARLVELVLPLVEKKISSPLRGEVGAQAPGGGDKTQDTPSLILPPQGGGNIERLLKAMPGLKQRAKTLVELAGNAAFYVLARPIPLNEKAQEILNEAGRATLRALLPLYEKQEDWSEAALQETAKSYAEKAGIKLGPVAQPLRAALSGSNISPGVFEVMAVLGRDETLARIRDVC